MHASNENMSLFAKLLRFKPSYVQAMTLVGIVIIAKVVSFFKEVLFAHYLGTSLESDYYKLLLTFFNFVVGILAANSLRPAFTPPYHRLKRLSDKASARFSSQVLMFVAFLAMMVFLFLDALTPYFFNGWLAEYAGIKDNYMLFFIMSFSIVFLFSLSSHFRNILHADGFHISAEITSIISAVGSLVGVMVYPVYGLIAVAVGYSIGLFLELCCLLVFTLRNGNTITPMKVSFKDEHPWGLFFKQWIFASSMSTLMSGTVFTDRVMAKYLGEGSVSVLDYAHQFISVFLTLGITSIGSILLTKFSKAIVASDFAAVRRIIHQTEVVMFTLGGVFVLFLCLFSHELVSLVYERGKFSHADTLKVASAQIYYSFQVPFHLTGVIYARHLSALSANGIILCIALSCLVVSISLNLLFMNIMGVSGIALSTSITYFLSFVMLKYFSNKYLRESAK